MKILMLAAENGALPGGKVGGMGDVLRDVPRALAALGHQVTVLTPSYGRFSLLPGARPGGSIDVRFAGKAETLQLYTLPGRSGTGAVLEYVLEHPRFAACGAGRIYCDDAPDRPFATDSTKFALFSLAVAQGLAAGVIVRPDVLHLHDWHCGTVAALLRRSPQYRRLAGLPLVFTIHNLAMQGIRPLDGDASSLAAWFERPPVDADSIDPRYPDCFNPMRAAIRLCDRVHAVSPTYAQEICSAEFGEGLQEDLRQARAEGRLRGILNGCEYPDELPEVLDFRDFLLLARSELKRWMAAEPTLRSAHWLALERVEAWLGAGVEPKRRLTLVSRFTEQKLGLLARPLADGRSALSHVLDLLDEDECLLALGNGQPAMERLFTQALADDPRLLFLCGFSERLSEQLYGGGDLFLMPSQFEPCGIAQMLAMRAGQPCLVHRTGGLADTVEDGVNGFVFEGVDDDARCAAMLKRLGQALTQLRHHRRKGKAMSDAARAARFPWDRVARSYSELLYPTSG